MSELKEVKFSPLMEYAIRKGWKTQTRRVIELDGDTLINPYGKAGDILNCNIPLKIKKVRVEQLQDISIEDAIAEGVFYYYRMLKKRNIYPPPLTRKPLVIVCFAHLWQSFYMDDPLKNWCKNPWVWVIEFEIDKT